MKPGFLFVTASFMVLISVEPQAAHANGDPRVGKLISQSGAALHVDALRSMKVIHAKGSVVATGLSGSGDDWNEMGGMREAALFQRRLSAEAAAGMAMRTGISTRQDW
jgi:hypothetical protein